MFCTYFRFKTATDSTRRITKKEEAKENIG